MVRVRRVWQVVCTAVVAALVGAAVLAAVPAQAIGFPLVRVDGGLLLGRSDNGVDEFRGIPFAAPPVGPLRWRAPQPAAGWFGVRDAEKSGNKCAQTYGIDFTRITTEDCLYLDVHVPRGGAAGKPVMVWIHGGAYVIGSGSEYETSELARFGDVVVVTINYRVGPFGFLAHPALDGDGQFGLMDQQAALRWVQRNIAAFGGDPANVTIFGESAGGGSVCSQIASPQAAGLFARGIAESGCAVPAPTVAQAESLGEGFARGVGCPESTTDACLRGKSTDELLAGAGISLSDINLRWTPPVGGGLVPLAIQDAFETGQVNRVPLLQGTNREEASLFVAIKALAGTTVTAVNYLTRLSERFGGGFVERIAAQYPLGGFPSPPEAISGAVTDAVFACSAQYSNQALARHVPVYAYEFDDPTALPPDLPFYLPSGSSHAAELPYVFGRSVGTKLPPFFSPDQRWLSTAMMSYWTSFARAGVPTGPAPWAPVTPGHDVVQRLSPTFVGPAASFGADHRCGFWKQLYDDGMIPNI